MNTFTKTLRNLQIILLALAGGLIFLAIVIMFMVFQLKPGGFAAGQGPQWNAVPLLTVGFLGLSVFNMLLATFLPPILLKNQISQWARSAEPITTKFDPWEASDLAWIERVPTSTMNELLQRFQTSRIISAALCEAAGMMSAIAYLLEGQAASLIVIGMAIALMFWQIPSKVSLGQWLFIQVERLQRDKT